MSKRMTKEDRKKRLRERQKENIKNRDSKGFSGKNYLNFSGYEDVVWEKGSKGTNEFDILPYIVSTLNHPQGFKKGEEDYLLDIWVHKFVGINNDNFVCLKKTFGKPCPICEEMGRLYDEGEDEAGKQLYPSHRVIYNVINLRDKETVIKIFDASYYLFEKELLEKLQSVFGDEEIPAIADLEDGSTVKFRATEETFNKRKFLKFKDFEFVERDEEYDEDMFDDVYPLDKLLVIPTYEEVAESFYGSGDETDEEDEEETECPEGFIFGEDYDLDPVCGDCKKLTECKKEYRRKRKNG